MTNNLKSVTRFSAGTNIVGELNEFISERILSTALRKFYCKGKPGNPIMHLHNGQGGTL